MFPFCLSAFCETQTRRVQLWAYVTLFCARCKHWYHYGCVGITRKEDGRLRPRAVFVCPVCEVHPYVLLSLSLSRLIIRLIYLMGLSKIRQTTSNEQ